MIDYLAAALEQEEPEEKELWVELDLKESLMGRATGENGVPPSPAANKPLVEPSLNAPPKGVSQAVETKGRKKAAQAGTVLTELSRGGTIEKIEMPLLKRLGAAGQSQPPGASAKGRFTPLDSARLRAETALDAMPRQREPERSVPLASALRRAQAGIDFVRRERRNLSVTLPEPPGIAGSLSAEELDRAVERDARRYDGGFSMY